jgi:inner membrane protein
MRVLLFIAKLLSMTARTHDLAAITAFGIIVVVQPIRTVTVATALVAVLANQLGGIAPDIDQPTAPFWRNLPIGKFFGKGVDKLLGGHRFITHSLLGLLLFGVGFRWLLDILHPIMPKTDIHIVWWAFIVGMISHLVLDTFTKEGVPWLLPIPFKFGIPPVKSLRITTGKLGEKLLFAAILALDFWYCSTHYQHLVSIFHHIS